MKIAPILSCRDLERAIAFYTQVLDFQLVDPTDTSPVRDLRHGDAELHLTSLGENPYGIAIDVLVDDVDRAFATYVARGLDTSKKPQSPVHRGPIDQTWGW